MRPSRPLLGPRSAQAASGVVQGVSKTPPGAPRDALRPPKMAQDAPKTPPSRDFDAFDARFWVPGVPKGLLGQVAPGAVQGVSKTPPGAPRETPQARSRWPKTPGTEIESQADPIFGRNQFQAPILKHPHGFARLGLILGDQASISVVSPVRNFAQSARCFCPAQCVPLYIMFKYIPMVSFVEKSFTQSGRCFRPA